MRQCRRPSGVVVVEGGVGRSRSDRERAAGRRDVEERGVDVLGDERQESPSWCWAEAPRAGRSLGNFVDLVAGSSCGGEV